MADGQKDVDQVEENAENLVNEQEDENIQEEAADEAQIPNQS